MKVEPEMMMEGLQPELPEEPPKVASFDYPIAELGAMVSGALGQSITPAEFRPWNRSIRSTGHPRSLSL